MNANWVNMNAKNTAMSSCHHESPTATNTTQPAANTARFPTTRTP
jgi:hypothetical protein